MREYFPENAQAKDIENWLAAGLHRGHIAYMPPLPLPDLDRAVTAEFLAEILRLQKSDPDRAAAIAVKGFPKNTDRE